MLYLTSPLCQIFPLQGLHSQDLLVMWGLTFAGPFPVKSSNLRKAPITKGYFCVFICLSVKAMQIEFVSDLSSAAFWAALQRFASRGLPSEIYSDCGSNFVGASRELKEVSQFQKENPNEIITNLACLSIRWHFNPPYASNFGALWKSAVKSINRLMYKQIDNVNLTFEEYTTIMTRIKAILNSRPLWALSDIPDGANYLTPAHFLIDDYLLSVPDTPIEEDIRLKFSWKFLNQKFQAIWRRWHVEYLNTLTQRSKWPVNYNPVVGQLVYVISLNCDPLITLWAELYDFTLGKKGSCA